MGLDFLPDYRRWHRIHEDLWTYSVDLKVALANAGRRMVAVRRDRQPSIPSRRATVAKATIRGLAARLRRSTFWWSQASLS